MSKLNRASWAVLALIFGSYAFAGINSTPVTSSIDQSIPGVTDSVTVKTGSTIGLAAGSAKVGQVAIDQTTPGTSNLVSIGTNGTVGINAALPAGTNLLGKTGIDQTTPGTTNGTSVAYIGSTAVAAGAGNATAGTQRMVIASDQVAIPVTLSSGTIQTRADTFTAATSGTTLDAHLAPVKSFTVAVKATGSVTSWTVVLECSLDNTNFTTVLTHTNTTPADGQAMFSGTSLTPCLYFRSRASAITLGAGTNVVATILGV